MRTSQKLGYCASGCSSLLLYPFIQLYNYFFYPEHYRFYHMAWWASRAFRKGQYEKAEALVLEYLNLAKRFKGHWDYGNAIHHGHQLLGRIRLRQGKVEEAKKHLILAGKTPGSPQLDSYGPRMTLARELLLQGEKEVVLKYLDLVAKFWAREEEDPEFQERHRQKKALIEQWKVEINEGKIPYNRIWY